MLCPRIPEQRERLRSPQLLHRRVHLLWNLERNKARDVFRRHRSCIRELTRPQPTESTYRSGTTTPGGKASDQDCTRAASNWESRLSDQTHGEASEGRPGYSHATFSSCSPCRGSRPAGQSSRTSPRRNDKADCCYSGGRRGRAELCPRSHMSEAPRTHRTEGVSATALVDLVVPRISELCLGTAQDLQSTVGSDIGLELSNPSDLRSGCSMIRVRCTDCCRFCLSIALYSEGEEGMSCDILRQGPAFSLFLASTGIGWGHCSACYPLFLAAPQAEHWICASWRACPHRFPGAPAGYLVHFCMPASLFGSFDMRHLGSDYLFVKSHTSCDSGLQATCRGGLGSQP